MTSDSSPDEVLGPLMEEFLQRKRNGEVPSLSEYVNRHPELEAEIRDLFPAVAMMEQAESNSPPSPAITRTGGHPRRLGDYRIIREVGRGGMGIVYEAIQESLGRHVALKVLPWQSVADDRLVKRFQREARISAALHHTNIVPVYGVGEADGVHFLAMQFIRGQSLDSVLREIRRLSLAEDRPAQLAEDSEGPASEENSACHSHPDSRAIAESLTGRMISETRTLQGQSAGPVSPQKGGGNTEAAAFMDTTADASVAPSVMSSATAGTRGNAFFRRAAELIASVAEAIDYAHVHGVVHRDIKPANVIIDLDGGVWVTDFGLAKASDSSVTGDDPENTAALTHTGDLVGTIRYLAPERFQGVNNASCDIYSLGLTLYEFVTLRPAFAAADRMSLIQLITSGPPPSARRHAPDVPRDLETIIGKATQHSASQRYASAAEMAVDLRRFLDGKPIVARRTPAFERFMLWCRRRPAVAALSGVIVTLVVLLALGSSIAAIRLNRSLANVQAARRAERVANQNAIQSLFDAYIAQASSEVAGISSGRHYKAMSAVGEAANLLRRLQLTDAECFSLRNVAIHGLVLDDLQNEIHVRANQPNSFHQKSGFDSDVAAIAIVGDDGNVMVTDLESGRALQRVPGQWMTDPLAYTRISKNQRYIATYGTLPTGRPALSLWDCREKIFVIEEQELGLPDWARSFSFSPDNSRFVYGTEHDARVLDLPSGTVIRTWKATGETLHAGFSRDGRFLALDDGRRSVVVVTSDPSEQEISLSLPSRATDADFSPDGRLLATSCDDNVIYIWDLRNPQEPLLSLTGHTSAARSVEFSPDGLLLASTGWDTTSRLWQPLIGRELCRVTGQVSAFSDDGSRLGFEGAAQGYGRYTVSNSDVCRSIVETVRESDIDDMCFHPSGKLLAFVNDEALFLYRWPEATMVSRVEGLSRLTTCQFLDGGDRLIASGAGGVKCYATADVLKGSDAEPIATCLKTSTWAGYFAVAADDESIIYLTTDGYLRRLHGETLAEIAPPKRLPTDHWFVSASPDGRWIASSGKHSNSVTVFDAASDEPVYTDEFNVSPGVWTEFSPDGNVLALSTMGRVTFLSTETWQQCGVFELGEMSIGRPAFSPDGTRIAIQSRALVTMLDASNFEPLAEFSPRFGEPLCSVGPEMSAALTFSADSSCLATGTRENSIHVWNLPRIHSRLTQLGLGWGDLGDDRDSTWGVSVSESVEPSEGDQDQQLAIPDFVPVEWAFPETREQKRERRREELLADLREHPESRNALFALATFHNEQEEWDDAARRWAQLQQLEPENVSYRLHSAFSLIHKQPPQIEQAIAQYEALFESDQLKQHQKLEACNYLAWFYVSGPIPLRDSKRALVLSRQAFAIAMEQDNDSVTYVQNTLGWSLFRVGQYEEAASIFERNIARRDNRSPVHDWLCLSGCLHQLGRHDEAKKAWSTAFQELKKADPEELDELQRLFREIGGLLGTTDLAD